MNFLVAICLLLLTPLSATHIFFFEKELGHNKKEQLFDLILRGEPPRVFYTAFDLKQACHALDPSIRLEWIPPAVWQLATLHAFFHDQEIRNGILACAGSGWEPLGYEQSLHSHLASASSLEEIARHFDRETQSLPNLCPLFFLINKAIVQLYERAGGSDSEMMRLILAEIPPFDEWKQRQFPFWTSPWIYNPRSPEIFYTALKDDSLLSELIKIEWQAYQNGEWVLYRGYPGTGYPSTVQLGATHGHALSFGSTLLGGTFFSLDATALTYAKSDLAQAHQFLALRVTPEKLKELFRVGPLHPLVQLLVDGEMFHAHTKIAAPAPDAHKEKPLCGYFMKCNQHCQDSVGYILNLKMKSEELEEEFNSLCKSAGVLFSTPAHD
jgi:hypothetical protein